MPTLGIVYLDQLKLIPADPDRNLEYKELMTWADEFRKLKIRTNAESPDDAKQAIKFGAEGIVLKPEVFETQLNEISLLVQKERSKARARDKIAQ